ncbi:Ubiquitin carboxyl-terminal hydrolase family protein [Zostera marina]|uniref:Ubiquitin carboxyl-terminal hydrolase family protein n=1 Tax=Zostera marina TaxID=29655 RepID=A0A0K9NVP7_ZOSMR|nr:Ubiquitin carboxyl-terminal hydrolase family protein [Zostera marina]
MGFIRFFPLFSISHLGLLGCCIHHTGNESNLKSSSFAADSFAVPVVGIQASMPFTSHLRRLYFFFLHTRQKSSSTSIPKNMVRVRDHGFDNYMEVEKKVRQTLKIQSLILSQPSETIPIARLDSLARRVHGLKPNEAGAFLLKHPHVFHVYEHPVQRVLWCRLTPRAQRQVEEEATAIQNMIPDAVFRLRKLVMLSNSGRIRLEHIRIARRDFGLPDDFEESIILKHPEFFRLVGPGSDVNEPRSKYVEMIHNQEAHDSPKVNVCAIDRVREWEYRKNGYDAEDSRFSFSINFPPGFKIGKYFRVAMWKWQRIPYWSPYEDVSGYDLRSLEARRRMEKRAVAVIHELLSLMVEKKTTMERIAHFRQAMDLPNKMKEFLLQHQGIFYISTRGNQGKLHTVFLREAYRRGDLVEPNELYIARRNLGELLLMSAKKVNLDRALTSFGRGWGGFSGKVGRRESLIDDRYHKQRGEEEEEKDDCSDDSGVESGFFE